ncbi:MAG TPA: PaaI family thioesterase, partial [Synergistales bacterium]|nr:PaaI family thioesterase [Synergistales bacterium]
MAMEKLEGSRGCFVCDRSGTNPRSLGVTLFWNDDEQQTVIPFTPDDSWCGYEGIVHGGILTALCDDAMAWSAKKALTE